MLSPGWAATTSAATSSCDADVQDLDGSFVAPPVDSHIHLTATGTLSGLTCGPRPHARSLRMIADYAADHRRWVGWDESGRRMLAQRTADLDAVLGDCPAYPPGSTDPRWSLRLRWLSPSWRRQIRLHRAQRPPTGDAHHLARAAARCS